MTRNELKTRYDSLADQLAVIHCHIYGKRGEARSHLRRQIVDLSIQKDRAEAELLACDPSLRISWRKLGKVTGHQILAHLEADVIHHTYVFHSQVRKTGSDRFITIRRCSICGKRTEAKS